MWTTTLSDFEHNTYRLGWKKTNMSRLGIRNNNINKRKNSASMPKLKKYAEFFFKVLALTQLCKKKKYSNFKTIFFFY